ncbi:hypothetical protein DD238_000937 [Peronospora effusa]|uniref:Alpha-taxilin n=1 Tax=Peronospora effusa TaxID=542832 RepID=A0A3M6VKV3_9STRA|nr:hypothetical protein DD238_000937 [Peronospora effusa]RQM16688.1 hypothetical protein DD237_001751 [Peronospora effusa]
MTDESPSLELKPLNRETKSLKHKHKSKCIQQQQRGNKSDAISSSKSNPELKRAPIAASPGRHHKRNTKTTREDALRELLAGKIAEIEVGGDENLDDLSAIYLDKTLPIQLKEKAENVKKMDEMTAEEKIVELVSSLIHASQQLELMQKKISELNAKCILLKQRKGTDGHVFFAEKLSVSVSTELVKTTTSKTKLEQLCRELQKQNKLIVSESRRIADEEDQKRRDLSAQFQKTIEEVSAKMDKQGQDYVASLKENENLQQKLRKFLEQYTAREEHFQRQLEAKDLTVQLVETKLRHQVVLTSREAEKVKLTLDRSKAFSDREVQLQAQLDSYSEKFDVVQETLSKSNEMFTTFREEMDKMAKTTKKLEKENLALKKKCAEYDSGAIASIQGKVTSAEETMMLQEKVKKLESLCRHLQAERKSTRQAQQI